VAYLFGPPCMFMRCRQRITRLYYHAGQSMIESSRILNLGLSIDSLGEGGNNKWRRNEFESGEHRSRAKVGASKRREKNFFLVVPLHFLGSESTINRFLVSAFVMVSTVWSVSCLLFFYSRCPPPVPAICKSGGTCPPVSHGVGAAVNN